MIIAFDRKPLAKIQNKECHNNIVIFIVTLVTFLSGFGGAFHFILTSIILYFTTPKILKINKHFIAKKHVQCIIKINVMAYRLYGIFHGKCMHVLFTQELQTHQKVLKQWNVLAPLQLLIRHIIFHTHRRSMPF